MADSSAAAAATSAPVLFGDGRYAQVEELGRGGEGVVYKVRRVRAALDQSVDPTESAAAAAAAGDSSTSTTSSSGGSSSGGSGDGKVLVLKKKYCASLEEANAGLAEAITMVRCVSEHVVAFEDVFLEPQEQFGVKYFYLCLVMEWCEGGDLTAWIRGHPLSAPGLDEAEDTAVRLRFARELLEGLTDVHAAALIHRDLKPDNVFLQPRTAGGELHCKVGDFGLAVKGRRAAGAGGGVAGRHDVAGTPLYMAPEVVTAGGALSEGYTAKADVWSMGCLFLELSQSTLLPVSVGEMALKAGESGWDPKTLTAMVPPRLQALADLAHQMLAFKAEDRPSAETLLLSPVFASVVNAMLQDDGHGGLLKGGSSGALGSHASMSSSSSSSSTSLLRVKGLGDASELMRRQLTRRDFETASAMIANSVAGRDHRISLNTTVDELRSIYRDMILPSMLPMMARAGAIWGLFHKDRLVAASTWFSPDKKLRPPVGKILGMMARGAVRYHPSTLKGVRKSIKTEQKAMAMIEKDTEGGAWFLHTVAVDPEYFGHGLGPAVIDPVHEWATHAGAPCVTTVADEATKDFFTKCGYVVHAKLTPEKDKTRLCWILVKWPPGAGAGNNNDGDGDGDGDGDSAASSSSASASASAAAAGGDSASSSPSGSSSRFGRKHSKGSVSKKSDRKSR